MTEHEGCYMIMGIYSRAQPLAEPQGSTAVCIMLIQMLEIVCTVEIIQFSLITIFLFF